MFDFIIHFNEYINYFIDILGVWFYILLFFIIFCETGIVLGIFFPGDSLLFTIGVTAAATSINIHLAVLSICLGAIIGDSCNYITGKFIGEKLFSTHARILKKAYLIKTKEFLDKYGTKAIIFSRFIAFVRTITPFVAGVSNMNYAKFVTLGAISAIIWSFSITYTVYFFSDNYFVKQYLSLIIAIIVTVVVIQMVIKGIINKIKVKRT
ncbi:VTT domain-containing protein [Francisella philomiragia]|uniref:VTT domain-containing protein n=1 Tax=Francisella philomiragia TaxID=28110 RepID=UPI0005A5637D|nr:VTT domain-containing protein [Francisella philomiragia]AJI55920.1 protein dedA [Francisella philomiragia]MBK2094738.1 VTT domain-containing protein [Francisella philomiragia]MBK2252093.1 VTT domain-containing protein [Francisella philomiragia]